MTTLRDALTMAVGLHGQGKLADAAGIYRLVLTVQPDNAAALNNLGLIAEPDEAIELFRRAVTADPAHLHAVCNYGHALQQRHHTREAIDVYRRAASFVPDDPELRFALGHALQRDRQVDAAAAEYERALALRPDYLPAMCNLATLHTAADHTEAAAALYRRVLAIDPYVAVANLNMVGILEGEGRLREAARLRARVPRPQPPVIDRAACGEPRRTVLVLASSKGNVPLDELLPPETTTRITWHVEYATDAQENDLPPYDVAFNGIGNADIMAVSASRVARFHARRPVLNPPEAVARTRRDLLPQTLAGIPNVVVPRVVRLEEAEMNAAGLAARLRQHGLACPVLIRPIVGHGGTGVVLVETADQLDQLHWEGADAYYVIAFHRFQSIDGYWRKYRTIFVQGQPFAYHLAISTHWLVHYATADMMAAPWKRQEEQCFLDDPAASLGPKADAALREIAKRLGLDFAGIDYALLPDGRLLVFEANATMLVHLREAEEEFPYKHRAVPKIFAAFNAMLDQARRRATPLLPVG